MTCSDITDHFTTILKLLQVNDTVKMLLWLTRLNILLDVDHPRYENIKDNEVVPPGK